MIKFSKTEQAEIVKKIQDYMLNEFNLEIGGFDAEFLLDFFSRELGCRYYNQALADVHSMFEQQMDEFADKLYQMEKPLP